MVLKPEPTSGDTSWFVRDRFGMFIHWGIYSLAARGEWVKSQEQMNNSEYDKYLKHFDPDLYDPEIWAKAAKDAGMKYFIVTTKHHDGFCLWDSKLTDYKATNTPAGRDLIEPMVEAYRKEGMRAGFYHSLLDWHHTDYTVDGPHPMRDNEEYIARDKDRDMNRYIKYLFGQVEEILTRYGKIDLLWFDFSVAATKLFAGKSKDVWKSEEMIKLVRKLQPHIIMNDRLDINQDVKTPEQFQPREWIKIDGKPMVWEACQTMNSRGWCYVRDDEQWRSTNMLICQLIDNVSKGGNYLLNVGPTGRGELDERVLSRLAGIGNWMKYNNKSIYGCTQAPGEFKCPKDARFTYNPEKNRLYLHLFNWPYKHIHLDNMADRVEYAQFLHDASEIKILTKVIEAEYGSMKEKRPENLLTLEVPTRKPGVEVPVIELFLK